MDTIVYGKKGAGKSYWAVHFAEEKIKEGAKVFHNIRGYENGIDLDKFLKAQGYTFLEIFTEKFQEDHDIFHGSYIILDEAQKTFPKRFRGDLQVAFACMTRHYHIELLYLTQDVKLMCPEIVTQIEEVYRAIPETQNTAINAFQYKQMTSTDKFAEQMGVTKRLAKKQEIFALYKSTERQDIKGQKRKRPVFRLFLLVAGGTVLAVAGFILLPSVFSHKEKPVTSTGERQQRQGIFDSSSGKTEGDFSSFDRHRVSRVKVYSEEFVIFQGKLSPLKKFDNRLDNFFFSYRIH